MEHFIILINQIIEIKQKIDKENLSDKFNRNFNRLDSFFEEQGYKIIYPLGEKYNETRIDCEATIIGEEDVNMVITQVIKPIIYKTNKEEVVLVQKGIVLVEKL